MKPYFIYPGTFCPPTYGHLYVVREACKVFPQVTILCSENEDKKDNRWFTPDECKAMWQAYKLPKNVEVMTLKEFMASKFKKAKITMIRGIRGHEDLEHETKVMELNTREFGINQYFYIHAPLSKCKISSSRTRAYATELDLEKLSKLVAPGIVSKLLAHVLEVKKVFIVAAKPGSGKSTFLQKLHELDSCNYFINTDDFNHQLRDFLREKSSEPDLIKLATEDEAKLKHLIKKPWFDLLATALKQAPKNGHIFVEVPYCMQSDKRMYRFLGANIIYVYCDEAKLRYRVIKRGTPEILPFIEKIPGVHETREICERENLRLQVIDANQGIAELEEAAKNFHQQLQGENYA